MRPVLVAALALAACAPRLARPPAPASERITAGGAAFELRYEPGDTGVARQIADALPRAAARVARWGGLRQPVTITIQPDHDALEAAAGRPGYRWLRAWARYATVDVQSPRTWTFFGASDREVEELLAHELAHCAMYQQTASEWTWPYKGTPLWFLEGFASVTAGQDRKHGSVEELWRFYRDAAPGDGGGDGPALWAAPPEDDPVAHPERIYREHDEVVYSAAHHAFRFLLSRYGEDRVRRVLALMGQGRSFARAFEDAIGLFEPEFTSDFRRYVVSQGWRRE